MSFISSIRDGENIGEAMVQREQAYGLSDCTPVGGVGTGFSAGMVGRMNGAAGANPNHFSVQANGSNLVLTIQPGFCWIVKDSGASTYDPKVVYVVMNASVVLTIPSNSQGTSRTDTICLRFDQTIAPDATGSNLPTIVDVQGGASNALGNAPNDGALYLPLANVVIANAAASVSQSNVTDLRQVQPSQARLSVTLNAQQSIPDNTFTVVAWDTVSEDPCGMFTTGAGAKWVAPLTGWYLVNSNVVFAAGATSMVSASMWISPRGSGTFYKTGANQSGTVATNANAAVGANAKVHLTRGDTLQVNILQHLTTPAALNTFLGTATVFYNFLDVHFLGFAGTVVNE